MASIRKELVREKDKVSTFFNELTKKKEELKEKETAVALYEDKTEGLRLYNA